MAGVCQLFHDKYQWEVWKNTAEKSAMSYVTFINRRTYTSFNLQQQDVSPYLQRIPDVGEKVDVGQAVHFEHLWIWSTALFQRGQFKIDYINGDLDEGVVDDAGADVDDVENGERHQQVVERRSHLGLPEVETIIRVLNVTILLKLQGHQCLAWFHYFQRQVIWNTDLSGPKFYPRFYQYE